MLYGLCCCCCGSFNIETTVHVVDNIQDEAFIVAQNNELFARVPLSGQLNEDTDAGKSALSVSVAFSRVAAFAGKN